MKIKFKGVYVYEDLGWHQNHSAKVVQMAAAAEMLDIDWVVRVVYQKVKSLEWQL